MQDTTILPLEELKQWLMIRVIKARNEGKLREYEMLRDVAEQVMEFESKLLIYQEEAE